MISNNNNIYLITLLLYRLSNIYRCLDRTDAILSEGLYFCYIFKDIIQERFFITNSK